MTIEEAVEIRERARALGLEHCCDDCRAALETLAKLGRHSDMTLAPKVKDPTYPQGERVPTLGIGTEDAARFLRRHIGAAA